MFKLISDVDEINGIPAVEWQYSDGHRFWIQYESIEAREKAIDDNELYNSFYEKEIAEEEAEHADDFGHMLLEQIETGLTKYREMGKHEQQIVDAYKQKLLSKYSV